MRFLFSSFALLLTFGLLATEARADGGQNSDLSACTRLSIDYAYYRDHGDAKSYANLFTEDGTLQLVGPPMKGREVIEKEAIGRMAGTVSRHVNTNIRVTLIDATHAEGVVYLTLYAAKGSIANGRPVEMDGPIFVSDYVDTYVKTKDGWRISSRKLVPAFASPAAFAAEAAAKAAEKKAP